MKATIQWLDEVSFEAQSGSGHRLILDGAPDHGGRNAGMRPMEAVLIGIGACSAFDVVAILKKARQAVSDCVVELEADRAETPPKVFTRIRMRFVVSGTGLKRAAVERAVNLSAEKYCSATAMLRRTVDIRHEVEIVEIQPHRL
jgi:putative redox protein